MNAPLGAASDLREFYDHLTRHIVPGPRSLSYFIPILLLFTALLIPPSKLTHRQLCLVFLPLIYACQLHAILAMGSLEAILMNSTLWSFVLLALRDPRQTHRRVWRSRDGHSKDARQCRETIIEEPYPSTLAKRIPWVLTLMVSIRLTGWRIGDPSHDQAQPPPTPHTRMAFFKHTLRILLASYLLLDATAAYVQTDPYFSTSGTPVSAPFPPPPATMPTLLLLVRSLPPRLLRSSILAAQIYAMVTALFHLPILPALGLHAVGVLPSEWSPHTWPPFFGAFAAVSERGLRGLWGGWWHSLNKQITATPGRELARGLGWGTGSTKRFAAVTASAFFLSGVIHMGMIPAEPRSEEVLSAGMMRLHVAGFFWMQIPGFAVEVAVAKLVARFAPGVGERSRGGGGGGGGGVRAAAVLAWTAGWFCLTLPLLTIPFREIGYWSVYPVPVSLLRGVSGRGWVTW